MSQDIKNLKSEATQKKHQPNFGADRDEQEEVKQSEKKEQLPNMEQELNSLISGQPLDTEVNQYTRHGALKTLNKTKKPTPELLQRALDKFG